MCRARSSLHKTTSSKNSASTACRLWKCFHASKIISASNCPTTKFRASGTSRLWLSGFSPACNAGPFQISIHRNMAKALSRFCDRGPQSLHRCSGPALRGQSSLKVLSVHTRLGPLLPRHLRSLWPVHLYELRFGWPSSQSEEARTLRDMGTGRFGPHLRLLRFREFFCRFCFPRFHLEFLLLERGHHS